MSIIRSAAMAVCWLDRSDHWPYLSPGQTYHIQRSDHGLTWPMGATLLVV